MVSAVQNMGVSLILPLGVYEQRLVKTVQRSGAQRLYLLDSSRSPYQESITQIGQKIKKHFESIVKIDGEDTVDYTNFGDLYRAFTKAISVESKLAPSNEIRIDVTATTKEATLAAATMAHYFKIAVSYLPRGHLASEEEITERYKMGPQTIQLDIGEEPLLVRFPESMYGGLTADELTILEISRKKGPFDSLSSLFSTLEKEGELRPNDEARQRYWIRLSHRLQDRKLAMLTVSGKTRKFSLSELGMGIAAGIHEANEYLNSLHHAQTRRTKGVRVPAK